MEKKQWTCDCGKFTLDVDADQIFVGYVPPVPEDAKTYFFHGTYQCLENLVPKAIDSDEVIGSPIISDP